MNIRIRALVRAVAALAMVLVCCLSFGADVHFTGSGSWNNSANWTPTTVPGSGDIAWIDPGKTVDIDVAANVFSIRVGTGGTLVIDNGTFQGVGTLV